MEEIRWTERSKNDLQSIYNYISQDSIRYAEIQIEKIIKRTNQILSFPKSGKVVPEYENPQIREMVEGNYRIIYSIKEDPVISILTIHHGAKELKKT